MKHVLHHSVILILFFFGLLQTRGAESVRLEDLQLGVNPTKKDVVSYVREIKKAVRKRTEARREQSARWSSHSADASTAHLKLVRAKLAQVPVAYIGVLFSESQPSGNLSFSFRVVDSINERTDFGDESKELILQQLQKYPALIDTVVENDWVQGAEKTVLKAAKSMLGLPTGQGTIPKYVPILAEIDLPEVKKLLPELLLAGSAFTMARSYNSLSTVDLPWLNMDDVVDKAWKKAQSDERREGLMMDLMMDPYQYAPIAARHGHVDALILMAKKLNGAPLPHDIEDEMRRTGFSAAILKFMPPEITEEKAAVKFILDNRATQVFDKALKEYKVGP